MSRSNAVRSVFFVLATAGAVPALAAQTPEPRPEKPVAAPDEPSTQVDASKGGFTVRSGRQQRDLRRLRAGARRTGRSRALRRGRQGHARLRREDGADACRSTSRKVRLSFRGTMFRPWVKVQLRLRGRPHLGRERQQDQGRLPRAREGSRSRSAPASTRCPSASRSMAPDTGQELVDRSIGERRLRARPGRRRDAHRHGARDEGSAMRRRLQRLGRVDGARTTRPDVGGAAVGRSRSASTSSPRARSRPAEGLTARGPRRARRRR